MIYKYHTIAAAGFGAAAGALVAWRLAKRTSLGVAKARESDGGSTEGTPASQPSDTASSAASQPTLLASADRVLLLLKSSEPTTIEGMDPALHYLAPYVLKMEWTALGDLVTARERESTGRVDGSQWISLRLDGCGFSKALRALRAHGLLAEQGFSDTFASFMRAALRALMKHFQAKLGYTQSDEMVVFIAPTNVVRGERQKHLRGGRVTKMTTLAASFVTAHFVTDLAQLASARGVPLDALASVLPHFDCRLGAYASWEEARALLMWRAYDCAMNGVSDAMFRILGTGKNVMRLGTLQKVAWLHEHGHLPLPRHQAYGTVMAKVKRVVTGHNPVRGEDVRTLRGVIEQVDGPVLELVRQGSIWTEDDVLSRRRDE